MNNVNQTQWEEHIANNPNAVILDVRTAAECAQGIIPNAQQLDVMQQLNFYNTAKTLDSSKSYYVYCRSGQRSVTACKILESVGIKETYNLLGGILAWTGKINTPIKA